MSITVSTAQQISQSPLNLSQSKQLWSFPKSQRFSQKDLSNNCASACYDLPNTISKRKAAFGYGTKYDFTQNAAKGPGPNVYNIKSEFENQKTGFSFGLGREQLKQQGIFRESGQKTPGPGAYDNKSQLSKTSYSFRLKTNAQSSSNLKVPGPGSYENLPSITKNGKYFISKFHNSLATVINPPNSKRFNEHEVGQKVPGPGHYKPKNEIGGDGVYVLSAYKTQVGKSFTHQERQTLENKYTKTPGPGHYRLPSEFGYYESAKVNQERAKSSGKL